MDQNSLIEKITAGLADDQTVRGLFLAGSFGREAADAFSDVDLIALVEPDDQAALVAKWRRVLESITRIVFWNERGRGSVLLNAITEDWLRCDMFIMPHAAFTGRARDTVKPLIDRAKSYEALPATLPMKHPNAAQVRYLINEFIRVLGLLRIVAGRGEYFTAASGMGLLRDHLVNLMLEEVTLPDRGGALHLSKLLHPHQMNVLEALPFPKPKRAEVIQAHIAIARQFFPRARILAKTLEIAWPDEFEAATRRSLEKAFGAEADISWQ